MEAVAVPRRKKRKAETETRFKVHGLWHRYAFFGGRYVLEIMVGNVWRRCANMALPLQDRRGQDADQYVAHPLDALCDRCKQLYSELLLRSGQPCGECKLEDLAERSMLLQEQGVELGWSVLPMTMRASRVSLGDRQSMSVTRKR